MKRRVDSWINELVWAISGAIVVAPTMESMPIPADVSARIKIERLVEVMRHSKQASDTEAMWYISTVSLLHPLDRHWTNIYMYLTRKFLLAEGRELPDFLKEEIRLDRYMEAQPLRRLKEWLYKRSIEHLKAKLKRDKEQEPSRQVVSVQATLTDFY